MAKVAINGAASNGVTMAAINGAETVDSKTGISSTNAKNSGSARGVDRRCIDALQARRCVTLVGPPGIGKTSMVTRLEQHWIDRGLEVYRASTSLSAQRVSLAALAGLLARESLTIAAAVNDLRSLSGLLVIDDADLLDEDSAVVIHTIARGRSVLLAVRDQRANVADAIMRLANDSGTERVTIEPLSATDAAQIVETRLGGPLDQNSIEELLRTSEGNPLLLRELLDASQHAGTLALRHGVWTLRELTAASTVREMFRERVARWPKAVAQVIATVAVAECVPKPLLVECFGAALVSEAQTLDAFRVRQGSGEIETRHSLLNDAVVADLTRDQRRGLLRDLVLASVNRQDLGVTHLRRGLWLSILGNDEKLDTSVVLKAADQAYSALFRRESLVLAELAYQHNPCRQTLEFFVRVGGRASEQLTQIGQTTPSAPSNSAQGNSAQGNSEQGNSKPVQGGQAQPSALAGEGQILQVGHIGYSPVDEVLRVGELMNRCEAYVYGLAPLGDLVEQIRFAEATTTDPEALLDYQMMNGWMEFSHGSHSERAIESLGPIARGDFALAAPRVASMPTAISYKLVGRLHESNAVASRLSNVQSLLQLALGKYCEAEANLELGRIDLAKTNLESLAELESTDNTPAKLLRCQIEARILLRSGRPREACRTLGTYVGLTETFDPIGGGAFARAWLAFALAWSGNSGDTTQTSAPATPIEDPISPPPYAAFFACDFLLAHAQYLAESGLLIDARNAALALVEQSNAKGQYLIAMWAAHLALRIQPSRFGSELVVFQAALIDGDLAETVAMHAVALVADEGPALEKVARRFVELGHLSLAHEAFVVASQAYRTQSQKTAAARCAKNADHLHAEGCVPSFAVPKATVVVEVLTLREREVSTAIAEGLSQRAVAEALGMGIRTVETHLHRAYRKLGVTNAHELQAALNN
jgi:DNA-binding CsgD family transcriptional regulator